MTQNNQLKLLVIYCLDELVGWEHMTGIELKQAIEMVKMSLDGYDIQVKKDSRDLQKSDAWLNVAKGLCQVLEFESLPELKGIMNIETCLYNAGSCVFDLKRTANK